MSEKEKKQIDRRTFVKNTVAGAVVGGMSVAMGHATDLLAARATKEEPIPTRRLGKTGAVVTIIGLPGWHIGRMRDESVAVRMIHHALDRGINFYDSAWAYEMGRSEERLGKALQGRRAKIFLMTKTIARDRQGAQLQLEQSLRRLRTDYLDLWQFHSLSTPSDVETVWGPKGAMEAAVQAKKEGKVRHIGFTGHHDPRVHRRVLQEYHDVLETVQMPISPVDVHFASFEKIALPLALQHNLGVIAMKTMANGAVAEDAIATPAECHAYAWTRPVSTAVLGMDTMEQLEQNVSQAIQFKPLTDEAIVRLLEKTKPHAGPGLERYKTDAPFTEWRTYPKEPVQ